MRRYIYNFLVFCLFISMLLGAPLLLYAQQSASNIEKARECFRNLDYSQAIYYYERAEKQRETNETIKRLAECYRQVRDYEKAEAGYKKVIGLPNPDPSSFFYYAEALENNGKYLQAASVYKNCTSLPQTQSILARKKVISCMKADSILHQSTSFKIQNLANLNTQYAEFGLTPYGSRFLLVSDRMRDSAKHIERDDFRHIYRRTNHGYLKVYISDSPEQGSLRQFDSIQGSEYHLGPVSFNKTEDTLYFSATNLIKPRRLTTDKKKIANFVNRLEMYYSTKSNGKWQAAKPFPYNKVTDYSVSHPAVSQDGHYLYFASDKPGGIGGVDLYYCLLLGNGKFGSPVNLGKGINTQGDELFPVIQENGDLYFSSNGHIGLGGLDIFKASGHANHWSKPENLGSPVNSDKDDFELVFGKADGSIGFFSSNRDGGKGDDDLYKFSNIPAPVAKDTNAVQTATSNVGQDDGKDYSLVYSPNAFDRYELTTREKALIDSNVQVMLMYPDSRVTIEGHADRHGSYQYNDALSRKRANKAYQYMIEHGIDPKRLETHAYGKRKPTVHCKNCTPSQDAVNRETRFLFIGPPGRKIRKTQIDLRKNIPNKEKPLSTTETLGDDKVYEALGEMEISNIYFENDNILIIKEIDGTIYRVNVPKDAQGKEVIVKDKAGHTWRINKNRTVTAEH